MSNMHVNAGGVSGATEVGVTRSLNMATMVFMLQALMADAAKIQLAETLEVATGDFTAVTELAAFLAEAKAQKQAAIDGKGNCPWDRHASMMSTEMAAYMDKFGLPYDRYGNDLANNPREWDVAISSLEKALAEKTNAVQTATFKAVKLAAICDFWLGAGLRGHLE